MLKALKKLIERILKMLKYKDTEIPTSATVTKNGTDVTTVKKDNTTVWEKQTGNPNPIWTKNSSAKVGSTPKFIIDVTGGSFIVVMNLARIGGTPIAFSPTGFTGDTIVDWEDSYSYATNMFRLSSRFNNDWGIFLTVLYDAENPFYGDGGRISNNLVYNPNTNKFTGSLGGNYPNWGDGGGAEEYFGIHSTADGGVQAVYGISTNGSDMQYYYGETVYLK
jgi:hypothetical protein